MWLIADSGSTKTDWRLIRPDWTTEGFTTVGFNPFYCDSEGIVTGIRSGLPPHIDPKEIRELHFYGAGCSSPEKSKIVLHGLKALFTQARIDVNHDLLGAARAMFHNEAGIVAIIGTGSNTCLFDGSHITKNFPSLGYILGDEGSGARLGIQLLKTYLAGELPKEISEKFYAEYGLTKEAVLDAVYCVGLPSRYLASFARFISRNLSHPCLYNIVYDCFTELFDRRICRYDNYRAQKIRCVGSVAFHFQPILNHVAKEKGALLDRVAEFPIDNLVAFHLKKLEIK